MTRKALAFLAFAALALLAACGGGSAPQASPTPTPAVSSTPSSGGPSGTGVAAPPDRDLYDLAVRYGLAPGGAPRTLTPGPELQAGFSRSFFVSDPVEGSVSEVNATLRVVTDSGYFFVESGINVSDASLRRAGQDFEAAVYPQVTAAFGDVRKPGVDGDPHVIVLITHLNGAGGYVTSTDEYTREVAPYSNEGEVIYMDVAVPPGTSAFNAVLAHELQHVVEANVDPNEDAWVNEGLSQVAYELMGGGTSMIASFLAAPDLQLNDWVALGSEPGPHYAASELFFRYVLGRFGGTSAAKELVAQQADSIAGVDAFLKPRGSSFRDVFADWIVANYLDAPSGPYSHADANLRTRNVTRIDTYRDSSDSVSQFGTRYLRITPPGQGGVFQFEGAKTVPPSGAGDGSNPYWWSSRGDSIDSRLTRQVDLTGVSKATLNFRTWFDTEAGWDYAYVSVSADDGRTWRALPGKSTTTLDDLRMAYGPAYTGSSGRGLGPAWVDDSVDLSAFAGRKVLLRFEYVTDDATNYAGFAVDDVSIPEIGLREDATSDTGWQAEGFLRIAAPARQEFIVELIENDDPNRVTRIALDADNRASIRVTGPVTIIIAGATDLTRERAGYRWSFAALAV